MFPFILTLIILAYGGFVSGHSVRDLGADDLSNLARSDNIALIQFVTPSCKECDDFGPRFEQLSELSSTTSFGRVDCSIEGKICDDVGVLHVPEVWLSRGRDQLNLYRGPLETSALLSLIERQHGPAIVELNDGNYHEYALSDYVSIVAFIDRQDEDSIKVYSDLAVKLRGEYVFALTHDSSRANDEGVAWPSVLLFSTFDERRSSYEGPFDPEALETFISQHGRPLIGELHPEVYTDLAETSLPLAQILVPSSAERGRLVNLIYPLARKYASALTFVTVDSNRYPQRAAMLNLPTDTKTGFAIENVTSTEKFPLRNIDAGAESITQFVEDFVAGKLKPLIRSQPVPVKQQGVSVELVGQTFKEVALNEEKDVLVEFYTPWCDYCLESHTTLEELAVHFRDIRLADKIVVGKIDVSKNDVPELITGYPTLKLYPAGGNPAATFNGPYHEPIPLDTLISFVQKYGGHQLEPESLEAPAASTSEIVELSGVLELTKANLASKELAEDAEGSERDEL